VKKLAAFYGFPSPAVSGDAVRLKSRYTDLAFRIGSRQLHFNGLLIWMHDGLVRSGKTWLLRQEDVDKVVDPLLRADNALASEGAGLVVLDAGHGGSDTGALSSLRREQEKAITLDLAKRVEKRLTGFKVKVRMTRSTDSYVSLSKRATLANSMKADVFVSIHLNRASSTTASGIETFIMPSAGCRSTSGTKADPKSYLGNKHDAANMVLGYFIHKGLLTYAPGVDRGIKRARFNVLKNLDCPAVLVECGFLSNKQDEKKLMESKHRDDVAMGISAGILTYMSRVRNAKAGLSRRKRGKGGS
jgi:N-acetylmuramoyl-L-alanine amidase